MPNQTRLSMGAPKAEAEALFRPDGTGSQQQGEDRRAARQMIPPPIIRRTIPTTITNRLRLRPLVRFDSMPMPAPTAASGMISQFAQPRKGMKAGIANKSATMPIRIEMMFSMAASWNAARLDASRRLPGRRPCPRRGPPGAQAIDREDEKRGPNRAEADRVGGGQLFAEHDPRQQELDRRQIGRAHV